MRGNSFIRLWSVFLVAMALSLSLAGCGKYALKKVDAQPGRMEVAMTASSFDFEPSVIQARKGATLVLKITNTSGRTHNFTISDPHGALLKSVDLPRNETATIDIELKELGAYKFHCDKFFHTTLGMKGRIDALP